MCKDDAHGEGVQRFYDRFWAQRRLAYIEKEKIRARYATISDLIGCVPGRKLIAGCGQGDDLVVFEDHCDCVAFDISLLGLRHTQSRFPEAQCVLADAESLPFADGSFSLVLSSEVLEHLQNPYNILKGVKEHLAKDGLFLVTTPNVALWRFRLQLLRGRFPKYDPSHVNFWDIDSFVELLHSYGYKVLSFYPTYFDLPFPLSKVFIFKPRPLYKLFGEQFLFICKAQSTDEKN